MLMPKFGRRHFPKNFVRSSNMSKIGQVVPEKISRNMTDTEKMIMTNIIENFVADNIVFGTEVLAHHPEELSLEIWEFTNFHQILELCSVYEAYLSGVLQLPITR